MKFKNLNKNLIENIIIIISIILVFICIAMIIYVPITDYHGSNVEWNGLKFYIQGDSQATVTNDSLIVTSSFSTHNVELKKTKDLTNYNDKIRNDHTNVRRMSFNKTHDFCLNSNLNYGAIAPHTDKISDKLNDGAEIIDVFGGNSEYMMSFTLSASNQINKRSL